MKLARISLLYVATFLALISIAVAQQLTPTARFDRLDRDGDGKLSGYAWGTNVGWINFDPEHGGVTISPTSGRWQGYAWAENVGWIRFKGPGYKVVVSALRVYLPIVLS